jgi:anti-sigma factor RsiW
MDCEKVKAQLSAYIDGEVAEKDAASIKEHIAICADCSQEEQLLRKTSELLRHWENTPAPDGFCEALLAKAENISHRPRRSIVHAVRPLAGPRALIKMVAYGAAVLLLCVGVIFFARLRSQTRAPMVEPLPTQIESVSQKMDDTVQSFENLTRYTTMAEMKVAGMWK